MTGYFNIFKCGRNILNRLDIKHEQVCTDKPIDKYYDKVLDTLVEYNDHHNAPFFNEKL